MAKQLAFYLNQNICTGCKACMTACKDKNDLPVGVNWRQVTEYGGGSWVADPAHVDMWIPNNVYHYAMSTACMHCENPACTQVCPAAAVTKRADGTVQIDQSKCIGCRYCEWACPYGAMQFLPDQGVMSKCNFCQDLVAEGQPPACVAACVMRALEFGELDDLRAKHGVVQAIDPLPDPGITHPAFVMTAHRHAQPVGSGNGMIIGLPEEE